ncbi:MAG: tyrosine-type recombinase/integrase [Candidatus Eremiobacteraeota bacterium]|nr:tyrosine-type recombinase/integrase [Candidatus Eremiobacteraeota bacterium]MCW5868191.1 tyrosine-type recombinase/integrase [Candidatus Eremiobacteraeota bacterium]
MTISQLLEYNLDDIHRRTRPAAWHACECHTRMFTALWGDRAATSLNRREVEEWAIQRRRDHSASTVLHEIRLLQRAYNLAVDEERLPYSPLARVRVRMKPHRRHQILTRENERALEKVYLKLFRRGAAHWRTEKFALLTGCRIGEQVRIQQKHIQGDILEIPEDGKTGSRLVPLCKGARTIIATQLAWATECGSGYVFWPDQRNPDRLVVAGSHVKHVWRKACREAGIQGVQRRDLRRTFACDLIRAGKPVFEVQSLLGHASPTQTMTYCHIGIEQLRATVAVLDELE